MGEYNKWLLFLQDEEPDVNEIQLAVLSTLVSNALGGKSKVNDFIVRKPKQKQGTNSKGIGEKEIRGALGLFTKKLG